MLAVSSCCPLLVNVLTARSCCSWWLIMLAVDFGYVNAVMADLCLLRNHAIRNCRMSSLSVLTVRYCLPCLLFYMAVCKYCPYWLLIVITNHACCRFVLLLLAVCYYWLFLMSADRNVRFVNHACYPLASWTCCWCLLCWASHYLNSSDLGNIFLIFWISNEFCKYFMVMPSGILPYPDLTW